MIRRVALVTDVSEELSASFIRLTRIGELGTTLAVTTNRRKQRASVASYSIVVPSSLILVTPMKEALSSSETSALTRATLRNISTPFFIVTAVKTSNLTRGKIAFDRRSS
jgi:hypothetical protein